MRKIINEKLEPLALGTSDCPVDLDSFKRQLLTGTTYDYKKTQPQPELISSDIRGTVYHRDMLGLLGIAWANHLGVRISPDDIWFTVLTQLVTMVKKSPERFKDFFTTSDKKENILVMSGAPVLDVPAFITELNRRCPVKPSEFVLLFSTTSDRSTIAQCAAFMDMVSPFYSYTMMMCGIPHIDVLGTEADWTMLSNRFAEIADAIGPTGDAWQEYFERTDDILRNIAQSFYEPKDEFWANIFKSERCGSGSDQLISGWYSDLIFEQPKYRKAVNFGSQLAKVSYKRTNYPDEFMAYFGLLSSRLEAGTLIPSFGYMEFVMPEGWTQPVDKFA